MKSTLAVTIVFCAVGLALGEEPAAGPAPPAPPAELTSLHGTMITMVSEDEGVPMEIWAKGDNLRAEASGGDEKIVTIQRGDTAYTFAPGVKTGHKMQAQAGLTTMGLVKQIAQIKAKGKREGSQEIEGVVYDKYDYDVDAPQEWAVVFLDAKTSLPRFWISAVRTGEKTAQAVRMHYRDMEANVDVPDALFELPQDVTFVEQPALPLQEAGAESPADAPSPPFPAE